MSDKHAIARLRQDVDEFKERLKNRNNELNKSLWSNIEYSMTPCIKCGRKYETLNCVCRALNC